MDSSTYRHLLGQLTNNTGISHHNFPSHNLLSPETLIEDLNCDAQGGAEFLASFPCYQPFPYVSQRSSVLFCGSGVTDYATEMVKKKLSWERKLKSLRVSNINSAIKHIKQMRKGKAVKLTNELKKYIEHFHNDPEPMFSGRYNWLYTGGCLNYDNETDGIVLIAADFFNKQPGFTLIKTDGTLSSIQYKSSCRLKVCSPVYQISCKSQQEDLVICVRQKNHINLFSRKKRCDSHPVKIWRKKVLGSKLLTCVDISDSCEEIIITDSSHDVHIFHMHKKDKIYCYSGKRIAYDYNRNSWSQVAFGELGIYWAFTNCFAILDVRDFCSKTKLEYKPTSATSDCEEICSFVKGRDNSNYVYLGTTHNVLQVDLRMGKCIQRWTHLLKNPPQFISSTKVEEKNEVLILQSQSVDEILGIVNECKTNGGDLSFVSKSLPCLLQSVKESLTLAHFNGVCLSPFVSKRMNFAVTGMLCLKNSENEIITCTTNSGGDIFKSKIKKKTSERLPADEDEQEVLKTMKTYESECEKFPLGNSALSQLQFVDMSHVLRDSPEDAKPKVKKQTKREIYWKYEEMYSPDSLKFFKDVLAEKILKVWGHGFEASESDYPSMSVDSKVREWMDKFNA